MSEEAPPSAERELYLGIQRDRLLRRARWGGVALVFSPLIPYELIDGTPQFIWQILAELPPAALASAFALSAAGVAIFVAQLRTKRAGSLALVVLTALATALGVARLGADRAAWDVLPLPESLVERPLSMLLGLALAGAGTQLVFKAHARRVARALLVASIVVTAFFYLVPSHGESPIVSMFRIAIALPLLPGFRYMLGFGLILGVLSFPAFVSVFSLVFALSPPKHEPRVIARLVTFGFPALLAFFVFRSLLVSFGDASLPGTLGSVVVLAALLGTSSAALETLGEIAVSRGIDVSGVPGWPLRRVGFVCGGASVFLLVTEAVLARPPTKGVSWSLGAPSPEHDHLFGELLGAWSTDRSRWDRRLRSGSSAQELVELKAAEHALSREAESADPGVKAALRELVLESRDLDLAGRRWHRLVSDVNDANRRAGYPYYVDPTLAIIETRDGLDRRFSLASYRIEAVRPVHVGSDEFATLHVRRLSGSSGHDNLLGFSRDVQPFALIVLDEIEPLEKELTELGKLPVPSCGSELGSSAAALTCGRALGKIVAGGKLHELMIADTERHELQHQIDGPHLRVPSEVMDRLGGYAPRARDRVNRELSAYLAEMSGEGTSPVIGLIALYRFSHAPYGHYLHHVAVLAASALVSRELEEDLDPAFAEIFALDDGTMRERVRDAWRRLYGKSLPVVSAG